MKTSVFLSGAAVSADSWICVHDIILNMTPRTTMTSWNHSVVKILLAVFRFRSTKVKSLAALAPKSSFRSVCPFHFRTTLFQSSEKTLHVESCWQWFNKTNKCCGKGTKGFLASGRVRGLSEVAYANGRTTLRTGRMRFAKPVLLSFALKLPCLRKLAEDLTRLFFFCFQSFSTYIIPTP